MISGRYRCGALTRHWSSSDNGYCSLSTLCHGILDDIHHILVECVALRSVRKKLFGFVSDYSSKLPTYLQDLIMIKCSYSNPDLCQFLLDCSLDHDVIFLAQNYGDDIYRHIFLVTRTWIYCLHRQRLKLLGLWRPGSYWPLFEQRRPLHWYRESWNSYVWYFSYFTANLRKSCFGCWFAV